MLFVIFFKVWRYCNFSQISLSEELSFIQGISQCYCCKDRIAVRSLHGMEAQSSDDHQRLVNVSRLCDKTSKLHSGFAPARLRSDTSCRLHTRFRAPQGSNQACTQELRSPGTSQLGSGNSWYIIPCTVQCRLFHWRLVQSVGFSLWLSD